MTCPFSLTLFSSIKDFAGLSSFEEELDDALKNNLIPASQGIYLRNRIDKQRNKFQEELQAAQYAEWWAQVGHQQQHAVMNQPSGYENWGEDQYGKQG